jgi:hypothetical protein
VHFTSHLLAVGAAIYTVRVVSAIGDSGKWYHGGKTLKSASSKISLEIPRFFSMPGIRNDRHAELHTKATSGAEGVTTLPDLEYRRTSISGTNFSGKKCLSGITLHAI